MRIICNSRGWKAFYGTITIGPFDTKESLLEELEIYWEQLDFI